MVYVTSTEWKEFIAQNPNVHLLQTSTWGDLKSKFGWHVYWIIERGKTIQKSSRMGAQILLRSRFDPSGKGAHGDRRLDLQDQQYRAVEFGFGHRTGGF